MSHGNEGPVDEEIARQWLRENDDALVSRMMERAKGTALTPSEATACFIIAGKLQAALADMLRVARLAHKRFEAAELVLDVAREMILNAKRCADAVGRHTTLEVTAEQLGEGGKP